MQEEQDYYNNILGDLSPYWGQPDVLEVFYKNYGQDEQSSDDEHDDYSSSESINYNNESTNYSD